MKKKFMGFMFDNPMKCALNQFNEDGETLLVRQLEPLMKKLLIVKQTLLIFTYILKHTRIFIYIFSN